MITNTHSVGVVRDAVIAWQVKHGFVPRTSSAGAAWWSMPVVAETYDGPPLNDINGFHVKPEHAFAAIDGARWQCRRRETWAVVPACIVINSKAARYGLTTRRDARRCLYGRRPRAM